MGRRGWMDWLTGRSHTVEPLPGRPPDGPGTHPLAGAITRAICCSGGGIRAAAFALGGMQELSRPGPDGRSWYSEVDMVTAVSGGSYMASSFAIVDHDLSAAERRILPAYAPGSPEDIRLRAHTRYLVDDPRAAAVGVLSILWGLVLNLVPILAGIYVVAKAVGWLLRWSGALVQVDGEWRTPHDGTLAAITGGIAAVGLLLYATERLIDVYHRPDRLRTRVLTVWTLRLLVWGTLLFLVLVGVPALLHWLSTLRPYRGPVTGPAQLSWLVGTVVGVVASVKATLGRFRAVVQSPPAGASDASGRKPTVGQRIGRVLRGLSAWLGSALILLLFLAGALVWLSTAAALGVTAAQVTGIVLCVVAILLWQVVTDVNRNSVHPFYKQRLATAFVVHRTARGTAEEVDYSAPLAVSHFAGDRPQLVVCAAVNTNEEGRVPSGRGCAPFTFDPNWTGISSGTQFGWNPWNPGERPPGMLATADYELRAGRRTLTLPAAVAVSGAAVSPVMGRMTRAPLRLLLGVANVRLGLWLPNPLDPHAPQRPGDGGAGGLRGVLAVLRWQSMQPGIMSLFAEMFGRTTLGSRWVYVTDGGHYENLGLVEAMRRGATEIVAFDASGDPPNTWATFGEAVETARADLGVEIDLDPLHMQRPQGAIGAPTLVAQGRFTYPNGVVGTLWLCKLDLPDKASWDVQAWARTHVGFPHDSTANQLYGDRQFEAYRKLGEIAAQTALAMMPVPGQVGGRVPAVVDPGADGSPDAVGRPPAHAAS